MIDKEQFIKDIKNDLGIQERKEGQYGFEKISDFDDISIEILKEAFKGNHNPENDITIEHKLKPDEMKNGCKKEIKYYKKNMENESKLIKINVNFPKNLKVGHIILLRSEGNRTQNGVGNLKILIK